MKRRLSNDFAMSIYLAVNSVLPLAVNAAMMILLHVFNNREKPLRFLLALSPPQALIHLPNSFRKHTLNTNYTLSTCSWHRVWTKWDPSLLIFNEFNSTGRYNLNTVCLPAKTWVLSQGSQDRYLSCLSRVSDIWKRQGKQWCKKWMKRLPGKCLVKDREPTVNRMWRAKRKGMWWLVASLGEEERTLCCLIPLLPDTENAYSFPAPWANLAEQPSFEDWLMVVSDPFTYSQDKYILWLLNLPTYIRP